METWQWIKAPPAVGKSDCHRQNKDKAMCLISRARVTQQQLWRLQQCNELTVIFKTTGESQPRKSPLYLILARKASTVINQLEYSKVCARWVPRNLTEERNEQIRSSARRRKCHPWSGITGPFLGRKSLRQFPQPARSWRQSFWTVKGVIVIDVLPRGQTINSDVYVGTLKKRFLRVRPHKDLTEVVLHHDNSRPHTSLHIREAFTNFSGLSCLIHFTAGCGSFRLPSFQSFERCNLRKQVWGRRGSHFRIKEVVVTETAVFCRESIQALTSRWRKAIVSEGDYFEK
jgi:predicted RNA-binding protein YlxR (DUF448 family)